MLTHENLLKQFFWLTGCKSITHNSACMRLLDTHIHRTIKALEVDGWKFKRVKQYIKNSKRFYFIYTLTKMGK